MLLRSSGVSLWLERQGLGPLQPSDQSTPWNKGSPGFSLYQQNYFCFLSNDCLNIKCLNSIGSKQGSLCLQLTSQGILDESSWFFPELNNIHYLCIFHQPVISRKWKLSYRNQNPGFHCLHGCSHSLATEAGSFLVSSPSGFMTCILLCPASTGGLEIASLRLFCSLMAKALSWEMGYLGSSWCVGGFPGPRKITTQTA